MRYNHPLYGIVTLISEFSSHCNVQTSSGLKPVRRADLMPYIGDVPVQTETITQPESQLEPGQTPDLSGDSTESEPESTESLENYMSGGLSTLNGPFSKMAKALPVIGYKRAKVIVENKPEEGYTSFDQFKKLNASLFDDEDVWNKIREALESIDSQES